MKKIYLYLAVILMISLSCSKSDDNRQQTALLFPAEIRMQSSLGGQIRFVFNYSDGKLESYLYYYDDELYQEITYEYTNNKIDSKTVTFHQDVPVSSRTDFYTHNSSGRLIGWTRGTESFNVSFDGSSNTYHFGTPQNSTLTFDQEGQVVSFVGAGSWNVDITPNANYFGPFYNLRNELLPLYNYDEFMDVLFLVKGLNVLEYTFGSSSQVYQVTEEVNQFNFVTKSTLVHTNTGDVIEKNIIYTTLD